MKSFSYLITLLKDQSLGLSKLLQLTIQEDKALHNEGLARLPELVKKKNEIFRKLKDWEIEKIIIWKELENKFKSPSTIAEKFQAAECKGLLLKQTVLLTRLKTIQDKYKHRKEIDQIFSNRS